MNFVKNIQILASIIFLISSVSFAKPTARAPQNEGFSGSQHTAMGIPKADDFACRRAASMASVSKALELINYSQDCNAEKVEAVSTFKEYNVSVYCGDTGAYTFNIDTKKTNKKIGCKVLNIEDTTNLNQ